MSVKEYNRVCITYPWAAFLSTELKGTFTEEQSLSAVELCVLKKSWPLASELKFS